MGAKTRKSLGEEATDYLPLTGGPGKKLAVEQTSDEGSNVVYVGRIPHGFYEKEMEGFFVQFGDIKRMRIARNKKTGKSKHYGFIEFQDTGVAKVVADTMNNYLLFEHLLQVHLVPKERIHKNMWKGFNYQRKPTDMVRVERKRLDKVKTLEEHQKSVVKVIKRHEKRQKMLAAAGIEYECPEFVGNVQPVPKKIRFE